MNPFWRGRGLKSVSFITADLDYPRLLALKGATKPGLILFRGGRYAEREITARLQRVLTAIPRDELTSSIVVVDSAKIRQHRLAIG